MYDNTYNVQYSSASMKIVVNGKTYLPKPPRYESPTGPCGFSKSLEFYVLDNDGKTADVYAILNGTEIKLELGKPAIVHLKTYNYLNANIALASQNITAQAYTSPRRVYLNLQTYAYYKIERDSTGTFGVIDSSGSWETSSYYDYKVTAGKTYRYRVRLSPSSYYWYDYAAARPNNYSNTVSVTVP